MIRFHRRLSVTALTLCLFSQANALAQDIPFVPSFSIPANGTVAPNAGPPKPHSILRLSIPQKEEASGIEGDSDAAHGLRQSTVPKTNAPGSSPNRTSPGAGRADSYSAESSQTENSQQVQADPPKRPVSTAGFVNQAALVAPLSKQAAKLAEEEERANRRLLAAKKAASEQNAAEVLLQPHSALILPMTVTNTETASQSQDVQVPAVQPKALSAQISVWDASSVNKIVDRLVDEHFNNSAEAKKLDDQVKHFRGTPAALLAKSKDTLNFAMNYQGSGPSRRMGQLVLSDKAKVRDATTAEYERQKYVDKIHAQVISSMMEIAMGLGMNETKRKDEIVDAGLHSLEVLVGENESKTTYKTLKAWLSKHPVPETTFKVPIWDTMERENKLEQIVQSALSADPVVTQIKARINRYANPTKFKSTASTVIESTLTGISLISPGFAIPMGAEAILSAYVASTGGSEEGKIERELVMEKRIQSRTKVLNQEASLALDNYRFAMITRNAPLLSFSQAVIAEMTSADVASKVFAAPIATDATDAVPEIKSSKQDSDDDT